MEGIHVSLPNKESLDNQHLRQKEQPSDCSVYIDIGKVQVLNKPTVIEDHGHLIYDYRNQQSASEKNITCTGVGDCLSREELMLRQKEQPSDCSVYIDIGKVQVLNKPTIIEDHGHLIYDYRNQQSASEKNITCTGVGDCLSREELVFAAILRGLTLLTDKEKGAQLEKLFVKLRKNEISRGNFIQLVKDIVGSQLFAFVVKKVHMKLREIREKKNLQEQQCVNVPMSK